jgi:NAD(P)-dependent dehydrogenase (short-subunit alcohol dehydrogenase family)
MRDEMVPNSGIPSFRLDGQIALVTGGGRGIGRGCANALAAAGARVVVVSRTQSQLTTVVEEIQASGGTAGAAVCDITDHAQVSTTFANLGQIDILVNNAGTNAPGAFLELTAMNIERLLALNVLATLNVTQAAAKLMVAADRGGAIINITSQLGHVGYPGRSMYTLTKHAIEGLTKTLALELAQYRIRVNSVAPTFIETPMTEPFFADGYFRQEVLNRIPLGRIGQVEDVVGAVVFLASPAASLITGTSLLVDGGWTAQ